VSDVRGTECRYLYVLSQDTDGSSECGLAKGIAAEVLSTLTDDR